jgi:hypothetical protein
MHEEPEFDSDFVVSVRCNARAIFLVLKKEKIERTSSLVPGPTLWSREKATMRRVDVAFVLIVKLERRWNSR